MWVKTVKVRGNILFSFRFADLQEANAYLDTVRNCNATLPVTYKCSMYDHVIKNLELRMKEGVNKEYHSYLYASEVGTLVTFCSPILSAAECFLSLTAAQLKSLYNL